MERFRGSFGHRQGHAEDGVRAETGLVRGAVQLDEETVDCDLVESVEADDSLGYLGVDRFDGAADGAVFQSDFDFYCGIAAGIEDLPPENVNYLKVLFHRYYLLNIYINFVFALLRAGHPVISDLPVMASGFSRPMRSSMVGAMSLRRPGRSFTSAPTITKGTRFVVWAV